MLYKILHFRNLIPNFGLFDQSYQGRLFKSKSLISFLHLLSKPSTIFCRKSLHVR